MEAISIHAANHCSIAAMSYRTTLPRFKGWGNPSCLRQRSKVMWLIWKCLAVSGGRLSIVVGLVLVAVAMYAPLWVLVSNGHIVICLPVGSTRVVFYYPYKTTS